MFITKTILNRKFYIFTKGLIQSVLNTLKKERLNTIPNTYIYSCYSFSFLIRYILKLILERKSYLDVAFGTIRFGGKTSNLLPEIPLSITEGFNYRSFHFVSLAERYTRRLLNLLPGDIYTLSNKEQIFRNTRYLISLVEIALRTTEYSKGNFYFYSSTTGNALVDVIFKKFYKKRYDIQVIFVNFSFIVRSDKSLYFLYKKVTLHLSIFYRFILPQYKVKKRETETLAFIHHKNNPFNVPYNYLIDTLSSTSAIPVESIDFMSILRIGSRNKLAILYLILGYAGSFIYRNFLPIVRFRLFSQCSEIIANRIYYICSRNTINILNIRHLLCSYISFKYENILYLACRDSKVNTIFYDYSMGYPVSKSPYYTSDIACSRLPDYILTFGGLRVKQYSRNRNYLKNDTKPIIFNSLCPQVIYAREKAKIDSNSLESKSLQSLNGKTIRVSIFDNIYGHNYHITSLDVAQCVEALKGSNSDVIVISHAKKRGHLTETLDSSNIIYFPQQKGDFSKAYYSDFIISIGFQGAALKASYAFNKPLIFFTTNRHFFEKVDFLLTADQNQRVYNYIKELTFTKARLSQSLENEKSYESFIARSNHYSKCLLNELKLSEKLTPAPSIINSLFGY